MKRFVGLLLVLAGCKPVDLSLGRDDFSSVAALCGETGERRLATLAAPTRAFGLGADAQTIFVGTSNGIYVFGSPPSIVAGTESATSGPIATSNGSIYFLDPSGTALLRVPKTGGAPTKLENVGSPVIRSFDARSTHTTWETSPADDGGTGVSTFVTLDETTGASAVVAARLGRGRFRTDEEHVYYPDVVESQTVISEASLTAPGSGVTTLYRFSLESQHDPDIWAVDETAIYYTPHGVLPLSALDKRTALTRTLAESIDAAIVDVAVGNAYVYWLPFDRRRIFRVLKTGGPTELVTQTASDVAAIGFSSCAVIWTIGVEVWGKPE